MTDPDHTHLPAGNPLENPVLLARALEPIPNQGEAMSWLERVLVVLGKEARDHFRDRRSLGLALVYPLLGPLLIGLMLGASLESIRTGTHQVVPLMLRQADAAPGLETFLRENKAEVKLVNENIRVQLGPRWPILLDVIPERPPPLSQVRLQLYYDATSVQGTSMANSIAEALGRWNREQTDLRIRTLNLNPQDLTPVVLERVPLGARSSPIGFFFKLIPPLVVFMIFLGAVYLAVDTTVGERERGTLEPLLTAPIRRWELLLGKASAAVVFTVVTVAINVTAYWIILHALARSHPEFDPPGGEAFFTIFLLALPLTLLAVALQFAVAVLSRSIKEAQIYLGLMPLVPALPGMAGAISPVPPEPWMALVPVLGQMIQFTRVVSGDTPETGAVATSSVVTVAAAVIIFRVAAMMFDRERNLTPG